MKLFLTLLISFFCIIGYTAPKIILKLDDLSVLKGVCKFQPTLDYLVEKKLKAGIGAIAI